MMVFQFIGPLNRRILMFKRLEFLRVIPTLRVPLRAMLGKTYRLMEGIRLLDRELNYKGC